MMPLHIVWAIILWLAVFILIPLERIKKLWIVAVITTLWLFVVNYFSIRLGYYSFHKILFPIFGSPLFHLIGGGAGGILLMNWMQRHPLYKIFFIFLFSSFFTIAETIYLKFGFFSYGIFDPILGFTHSLAMISILIWLNLGIVGDEIIYDGNRSRFNFKRILKF